MWLQVSLLARRTKSAAKLRLEIPTRDIKLETVLPWKQRGRGGIQAPATAGKPPCSQEAFKKAENQILGWRWSSKGTSRLHCSPLKTLRWSQLLTVWLCTAARACLQPPSSSSCPPVWVPQSLQLCPLPHHLRAAAGTQGTVTVGPGQAKSVGTCCWSPIHTGARWQKKAKKAEGGFFFSVEVLLPFFWLNFGKDPPYARFSGGLTIRSNPFLTLCCSQGSRTRFCFLSLFNS